MFRGRRRGSPQSDCFFCFLLSEFVLLVVGYPIGWRNQTRVGTRHIRIGKEGGAISVGSANHFLMNYVTTFGVSLAFFYISDDEHLPLLISASYL